MGAISRLIRQRREQHFWDRNTVTFFSPTYLISNEIVLETLGFILKREINKNVNKRVNLHYFWMNIFNDNNVFRQWIWRTTVIVFTLILTLENDIFLTICQKFILHIYKHYSHNILFFLKFRLNKFLCRSVSKFMAKNGYFFMNFPKNNNLFWI